jgi:hypothetical protein
MNVSHTFAGRLKQFEISIRALFIMVRIFPVTEIRVSINGVNVMAGHSKWANIQHRKGRQDEKRGKIFTRLIKEITVAARLGDSDPASNPRLRLAMEKAYDHNMPKDNVERAIKRGSGELDGVDYVEICYEGYGINGAAVMVNCMTDNKTRTVADVRFYQIWWKFGYGWFCVVLI